MASPRGKEFQYPPGSNVNTSPSVFKLTGLDEWFKTLLAWRNDKLPPGKKLLQHEATVLVSQVDPDSLNGDVAKRLTPNLPEELPSITILADFVP